MPNSNNVSRRQNAVKNKFFVLLIILLLVILPVALTACDDTAGRNDHIYLQTFRTDGYFVLPIKVERYATYPSPAKPFKSRQSLEKIYRGICGSDAFQAELHDGFILLKDASEAKSGYCMIYPKKTDRFNYVAYNMSCDFKPEDSEAPPLVEILAPMHFIPELAQDRVLTEGKEYALLASKTDVINFYKEYGFDVKEDDDSIVLKDNIGRTVGFSNSVTFDETLNAFALSVRDDKISFHRI